MGTLALRSERGVDELPEDADEAVNEFGPTKVWRAAVVFRDHRRARAYPDQFGKGNEPQWVD